MCLSSKRVLVTTYDQYPNVLTSLDLETIVQRLVCRSEGQAKARRLDEIE